jgi:ABC-2 type transport system ATP-binding protein
MLAIEIRDLEKTYTSGRRALAGVTLEVPAGQAMGLIGPNGAGKTTLIKCLLAIVRPERGSVWVLGGSPEDPDIRARIGYMPERIGLPEMLTALQAMAATARLKRLPVREGAFRALLERVGLVDAGSRRVGTFSKGMRQRLGLALALLGQPDILVLDEPTDGVDPGGRIDFRRLIREEVDRGCTVLLNSHILSETERICHRAGILIDGRIHREGAMEDLCHIGGGWRLRFSGTLAPGFLEREGFTAVRGSGDCARNGDLRAEEWSFAGSDPSALNRAIDRVRGRGALLVELQPAATDLEAVFANAVEQREAN